MSTQPTGEPDNSRPEAPLTEVPGPAAVSRPEVRRPETPGHAVQRPEAPRLEPRRPAGVSRPEVRRPAGVSRLGVLTGFLATAGTLVVALFGLGGPPSPVTAVALADASATEPAAEQVVVKTVYVQLPSPPAAPVAGAAAPKAAARVVTRQSGAGGDDADEHEGAEHEGDDD